MSQMRKPRAAVALLVLALGLPLGVTAGPGHDHGDEAAAAPSGAPQRQPDGSVFLPKAAQRQMGVRTRPVAEADLPRSLVLQGLVVMDPNAGGQVQPTVSGRIEAPPTGLPNLGQAVRRGQVLAHVVPAVGALERAGQAAQLAELRSARTLAEQRVARLTELADTVPRREIEAAEAERRSLGERIEALSTGLASREALVAPVSGVIASAHAVAGQVVDARAVVFEVVDPQRLRVEALAFDTAVADDIGAAFLVNGAGGSAPIPLRFVGSARRLREQALPLSFVAEGPAIARLAVGQPVQVAIQSKATVKGFAVPAAALMKNPSNQTIVWTKASAERFVPKVVAVEPLDGVQVAVTSGLAPGDRVVLQGATLVNQVR
jgi:membrane fusion protein, heavy metal efflux system